MKKLLFFLTLISLPVSSMENAKNLLMPVAKEIGANAAIVGGAIGAACLYGIINDQITARICPEYFSQGFHKNMRDRWNGPILGRAKKILEQTKSPTVVASIWGPIATWFVGAGLGIPAAMAARIGSWPQLGVQELVKPIAVTLAITGMGALIAGAIGYKKAGDENYRKKFRTFNGNDMKGVPVEAERGFITDAYAHGAAYGAGTLAGIGLIGYILVKRYSMS